MPPAPSQRHIDTPHPIPLKRENHLPALAMHAPVTDSRLVHCTRPWATLHAAVDNVAHGHGQRCTRPWTTNNTCSEDGFRPCRNVKTWHRNGQRPAGALELHAHSYLVGRDQSQAMDRKARMRSNVTHVSHFYPFYNARMRCLACPAKPSETR